MIIDAKHLYKEETGSFPEFEETYEFEIFRSKGQWIMGITDEEKFKLFGNDSTIEIETPCKDYIKWLENKIIELSNNQL